MNPLQQPAGQVSMAIWNLLLKSLNSMFEEIRELRRILRYRTMVVRTSVKMKNKISGLLMEVGASYDKQRIHRRRYFEQLLERVEDVPDSVKELLVLSRSNLELFEAIQKKLIKTLRQNDQIKQRVELLMSIAGVGEITALTWVLEIGDLPDSAIPGRPSATVGYAAPEGIGRQRTTWSDFQET